MGWHGGASGVYRAPTVVRPQASPGPHFAHLGTEGRTFAIKVTQFALNTSTGTQNVTVSGAGTCAGYWLFAGWPTSNNSVTAESQESWGFVGTDGSALGVATAAEDAVGTSDALSYRNTASPLTIIDPRTATPAVECEADHNAFITDGFQIDITTAPASAILVTAVIFYGDVYLEVATHTTETTDDTEAFTAIHTPCDLLVTNYTRNVTDTDNAIVDEVMSSLGAALPDLTQRCSTEVIADGVGAGVSFNGLSDSRLGMMGGSAMWEAQELTTVDPDQIGITTRNVTSPQNDDMQLCVCNFAGLARVDVGSFTMPTANGNVGYTGPGWKPQFVLQVFSEIAAFNNEASGTLDGTGASIGRGLAADNSYYIQGLITEDGPTTTNQASLVDSQICRLVDHQQNAVTTGTFVSFDSSGWTVNYSANGGVADQGWYLAIEEFEVSLDQNVSVAAIAAGTAIVEPNLNVELLVGTIPAGTAIVAPVLDVELLVGTIAAGTTITATQVSVSLLVGTIPAGTAVLAPVLDVELLVDPIAAGTAVVGPVLDVELLVGTIAASTTALAPVLNVEVTVGTIAAGTAILAPDRVDQTVNVGVIAAGTAVVQPVMDLELLVGTIAAATDIIAPVLDLELLVGPIAAATAITSTQVSVALLVDPIAAGTAIVGPVLDVELLVDAVAASTAVIAPDRVDQTVDVGAIAAGTTILAPTVDTGSDQNVTVGVIAAGTAILEPAMDLELLVGAIPAATAVLSPVLDVELLVATIPASTAILAPVLDVELLVGVIQAGTAVVGPVLDVELLVDATSAGTAVLAPTLDVELLVDPIAAGTTILAPTVLAGQTVAVAAIPAGTTVLAPTLDVELLVQPIAAATSIVEPAMDLELLVGTVQAGTTIVAPDVALDQDVSVGVIAAGTTVVAPDRVDRDISVGAVAAGTEVLSPTISGAQEISVGVIAAGTDALAPVLDVELLVPTIAAATDALAPLVGEAAQTVLVQPIAAGARMPNTMYVIGGTRGPFPNADLTIAAAAADMTVASSNGDLTIASANGDLVIADDSSDLVVNP